MQTLKSEIARGSHVEVSLSQPELSIAEPHQTVIWRGEPVFCQFAVRLPDAPAGTCFYPVVRIAVGGALTGRIMFSLRTEPAAIHPKSALQGEQARAYTHAFLSYASPDRKEVLKRAQALAAARVSYFQDVLKLDPGARWEREIYKNIDRCDLFLLFWSQAARDSEWVIREAEYALRRQDRGDEPDIVPVILESPPPLPPPSLAAIHFNDRIHTLIEVS
jgi:hypothetical protein